MASSHVRVTTDGGVTTITLDRPEKRNAMDLAMWEALRDAARDAAADPAVRVVVVTGAGDHFCAGADISALGGADAGRFRAANQDAEDALAAVPKPTIAAIRGSCVGGGAQIATACDLRFADDTARVGITPARLGVVYPPSGLERVVPLIGPGAAKHLLYSAELIDADRAHRIGFLDEVHASDDLHQRVSSFAALLATERSLLTQQASKAMIDQIVRDGALDPDLAATWSAHASAAPDELAEGRAAFAERRSPVFPWTGPRT